jgi:hypothetical protein
MPDDLEYDVLPSHSAKDQTGVGSSWAPGESHTFRVRDPWKKQRCFIPVWYRRFSAFALRSTRPNCAMTKRVRLVSARGVKSEFPLVGPKPQARGRLMKQQRIPRSSANNELPFRESPARPCGKRGIPLLLLGIELWLVAGITGCAPLPKVGPFVEASNQLRSAVAASGTTVEAELRLMPDGARYADQLEQQWEARNKAFVAMVAYANSLQAIVDAGNEGAASAQKVADSVSGLAAAAGMTLPGAPQAIAVATDAVKFISAQIALVRGAKSLEQALETAQPAVEAITDLVAADLQDLEVIFVAASKANDNAVRTSDEFKDLLGYRVQLVKQIGKCDPADTATCDRQVQLGQMLQATDVWLSKYLARRKEIDDRLRAGRALIQATLQSARDWGIAHGNLIMALKERRPVNMDSLVQAALEIQNLVRKVREL